MSKPDFIWDKQQCIEAYEDLMIKIAMSSYAEIEGEELLEENEQLKGSPQFQLTPEIEAKIRRIAQRQKIRKSVYRLGKGFYAVTNKVAMIFLAIFILFSTTMAVSAEFRSAIYQLVFAYEKRYTLVELDHATDLEFVDSEIYTWEHAFAPTMMPQGYIVEDVLETSLLHMVIYTNNDGGYIDFSQSSNNSTGTIRVDTEDAQLVQTVQINDSEGLLVNKNERNTLVWRVGNAMLAIESNENIETMIAIAQNIKLLK